MKSVHEVCELSGISRRTLQYYDEIGLLPPSALTEGGYRLYGDEALERLWRILFYKQLGLPLDDIKTLLDGPGEQERKVLAQQREKLAVDYARIGETIKALDAALCLPSGQAAIPLGEHSTECGKE